MAFFRTVRFPNTLATFYKMLFSLTGPHLRSHSTKQCIVMVPIQLLPYCWPFPWHHCRSILWTHSPWWILIVLPFRWHWSTQQVWLKAGLHLRALRSLLFKKSFYAIGKRKKSISVGPFWRNGWKTFVWPSRFSKQKGLKSKDTIAARASGDRP